MLNSLLRLPNFKFASLHFCVLCCSTVAQMWLHDMSWYLLSTRAQRAGYQMFVTYECIDPHAACDHTVSNSMKHGNSLSLLIPEHMVLLADLLGC